MIPAQGAMGQASRGAGVLLLRRAWIARSVGILAMAILVVPGAAAAQERPAPPLQPLAVGPTYSVTIDTSGVRGAAGKVAFDLTSNSSGSNSIDILNFATDGTLGLPETEGGFAQGDLILGSNPAGFTRMTGSAFGAPFFFSELGVKVKSFGNSITFQFTVSQAFVPGQVPDQFSLFLLDGADKPLFPTADPLGANALLAIEITGSAAGQLSTFDPTVFTPPTTIRITVPGSQQRGSVLRYTGDTLVGNGRRARLAAVLTDDANQPLAGAPVSFTLGSGGAAQVCAGTSDAIGAAACELTVVNQPGGPGTVTASFAGDSSHRPVSLTTNITVDSSLALNGVDGFAEVADAPDLNLIADWTVEAWFKDESPLGFNHDYMNVINKGDYDAHPESPYLVAVGFKMLVVGQRTAATDQTVNVDLFGLGVDPSQWHHVAASFLSSSRTLVVYLDGLEVGRGVPDATSSGNNLPVQIGRNGPVSGKNWQGKIDDVRIWNVVRSATQVNASFRRELASPSMGLVANWKFDEGSGTTAADAADSHPATLSGGAIFSTDVHPDVPAPPGGSAEPADADNVEANQPQARQEGP